MIFYFKCMLKLYDMPQKKLQELGLIVKGPLISLKAPCVRVTSKVTKEQLVNSIKQAETA